jgi:hypothetical protein
MAMFRTACIMKCQNCTIGIPDKCESCDQTRNFTSFCNCKEGNFELTPLQEICGTCSPYCLNCLISSENCTDCDSLKFRKISNNKCLCFDGYFQNFSDNSSIECKSFHLNLIFERLPLNVFNMPEQPPYLHFLQ